MAAHRITNDTNGANHTNLKKLRRKFVPFALFAAFVFTLLLAACEKPGEGQKAAAGYAAAAPVIEALGQYQAQAGRYPESLDALVPGYLDEHPDEINEYPLEYEPADDGSAYELRFRYTGPGMNICTYRPGEEWDCYGYF